ncbi:hypothetical protein J6590_089999 [Homalodisca vitripennis]|nr:hypothetical protein J6590_089999 [Homalodisca vitripennis]
MTQTTPSASGNMPMMLPSFQARGGALESWMTTRSPRLDVFLFLSAPDVLGERLNQLPYFRMCREKIRSHDESEGGERLLVVPVLRRPLPQCWNAELQILHNLKRDFQPYDVGDILHF